MKTIRNSVAMVAGAAAVAFIGAVAVGSLPIVVGLATTVLLCAGLGYVAFAAQSGGFDPTDRAVYRPVYVRSRIVHRRFGPRED